MPIDMTPDPHNPRLIAAMRKPMTLEEIQHSLDDVLCWDNRSLAAMLAVDERTVRRWRSGEAIVPEPVSAWLRLLVAFHQRHPPPAAPARRAGPGRPPGGSLYSAPKPP